MCRVCVFPAGFGSNFQIIVGSASGPGSTFKAFLGSARVRDPLRVGSVQHIYGSLRVRVRIFGPVKTSTPPYTYPNPTRYFIFNFLIISFIFIEKKICFSDVIWNLKREKKSSPKGGFEPGRSRQSEDSKHFTNCSTRADICWSSFVKLTSPITRWWAELV